MKPVIAVVGPSACTDRQAELAEAVGRLLAEREAILVSGGRGGVMEAACKGAESAGGTTLGILPGPDLSQGNAYLTIAIPTGMGEARNALVARAGQAMIAIGGSYGTLSEIALALKFGRPVIGLESWSATSHSGSVLEIRHVKSAAQAVDAALSEIRDA